MRGQVLQGRSQTAEIVTHIKGRLLERAAFLINRDPFQKGSFLKGKNLLEFFPLKEVPYDMEI